MRLWHWKLIPYLPKSQLLGQWRELNSIFKKQDKHILINYVYEYPKQQLELYAVNVIREMDRRGYTINLTNFNTYFGHQCAHNSNKPYGFVWLHQIPEVNPFKNHHNDEYLAICYWNLREKYIRGQKDFTPEVWEKIEACYMREMGVF